MANFLLGLAKGFADAGNESIKEAQKFNMELEKAARIQAMEAYAEDTKLFDQMQRLKPGSEVAAVTAAAAGFDWENMSATDQQLYTQYALENHDELIKQYDPGDAPTWDNYKDVYKRPKVIQWIKDKTGLTPPHAYGSMKAKKMVKENKLPSLDISGHQGRYVREVVAGNALYGVTAEGEYELIGDHSTKKIGKFNVWYDPKSKRPFAAQEGSPMESVYAAQGMYQIKKPDPGLSRLPDYEENLPTSRTYLDGFITAFKDMTAVKDEPTKHAQQVASVLEDWRDAKEGTLERSQYDFVATRMIEYEKDLRGEIHDLHRRWNVSMEKAISEVQPGIERGITISNDFFIPWPAGFGREGEKVIPGSGIGQTGNKTTEQRVKEQLTQDEINEVINGTLLIEYDDETEEYWLYNSMGQEIKSGKY